jgi:hypothetical protein
MYELYSSITRGFVWFNPSDYFTDKAIVNFAPLENLLTTNSYGTGNGNCVQSGSGRFRGCDSWR